MDTPAVPTTPKPTKPGQAPSDLANQTKEVEKLDQALKNLDKTRKQVGLTASERMMCLLRLDMLADKLDHINPRLARRIDEVAEQLENNHA